MQQNSKFIQRAQVVVSRAREALADLSMSLDTSFIEACQLLESLHGHVITVGVGKSGFIAQKMAATLASLGQPAFFLHPTDAGHGDLGNVTGSCGVIVFSHSGETIEVLKIMSLLRERAAFVLAICGSVSSSLAEAADVCLSTGASHEGCAIGLAPTTSTTSALVMADCLACCVAEARQFGRQDFAQTHPFGRLGQLTTKRVSDEMLPYDQCPVVYADGSVMDSIIAMAEKSCSVAIVIDARTRAYLGLQSSSMVKQALAIDRHLTSVKNAAYLITNIPFVKFGVTLQEAYDSLGGATKRQFIPVMDEDDRIVGLWQP